MYIFLDILLSQYRLAGRDPADKRNTFAPPFALDIFLRQPQRAVALQIGQIPLGFEVLEQLRQNGIQTPVLVLTARERVPDRIRALDSGADDYVVKPCDLDELCARIRALFRRGQGMADPVLVYGDLTLNPAAHSAEIGGEPLQLSSREFVVLQALLENVGRVLSRQRLEDILYGWDNDVGSNTVEVHIHHLRSKLGFNPIRTIRGVGYIIEKTTK